MFRRHCDHQITSRKNIILTSYLSATMSASPAMSTSSITTAECEEIISVGHILLPTLAPIAGGCDSPVWEERNRTVAFGLTIIQQLHMAYLNARPVSDHSEYGYSAYPMTLLAEAGIRAVKNAIYDLSFDNQCALFFFFDALPPHADGACWLHDNIEQQRQKNFTVAPQAFIIKAGYKVLGEIMQEKPAFPDLYRALSRTNEVWREKERDNQEELNGMFWLGRMVEEWGHDFFQQIMVQSMVE
jgi:hypothetical protein